MASATEFMKHDISGPCGLYTHLLQSYSKTWSTSQKEDLELSRPTDTNIRSQNKPGKWARGGLGSTGLVGVLGALPAFQPALRFEAQKAGNESRILNPKPLNQTFGFRASSIKHLFQERSEG